MHSKRTSDAESGIEPGKGQYIVSSWEISEDSWAFKHEQHRHTLCFIAANEFGHYASILSHRSVLPRIPTASGEKFRIHSIPQNVDGAGNEVHP